MTTIPADDRRRARARGYVSYSMVVAVGLVLTLLLLATYRAALQSQEVQSEATLRLDYSDKEDAFLRALVSIVPNRAIRAMQRDSNSSAARESLRWQDIYSDALDQANARASLDPAVAASLGITGARSGNAGDSALSSESAIFDAIEPETGYVSPGVNRSLGPGFPVPLNTDSTTASLDWNYPIISRTKVYGSRAEGLVGLPTADYPEFNLIPYPEIHFGYAQPGQPFVAKRTWWAFSMDLSDHDDERTGTARFERDMVLSIYEVPSQLGISAAAFASFGRHENGVDWQNVTIEGGVFATRSRIERSMEFERISARRGMELLEGATVDGTAIDQNSFQPGVREQFEMTSGTFFPVSLASESGRAAFIPINRGADFFDRFAHSASINRVSPTDWNRYSVGALQCAMRLDVVAVRSEMDQSPTMLRFSYLSGGSRVEEQFPVDPTIGNAVPHPFPFGYEVTASAKHCIVLLVERLGPFLASRGADGLEVNNSIVINADYTIDPTIRKPSIPCRSDDLGVILRECGDLSPFTDGFSLVTNFRLYLDDDFNIVDVAPPAGSGIPSPYYPPVSLFAPEKRYGANSNPWRVNHDGQTGSLAGDSATPAHLIDFKNSDEQLVDPSRITVNLKPIRHPAALPPVNVMNWLVVIEERRREYYGEGRDSMR